MKPYSFFNLDASSWQVGQRHAPTTLSLGKLPGIHCTRGLSALGTVWSGAENFAPMRIQSLDQSALKGRLYRLNHPTRVACPWISLILCD